MSASPAGYRARIEPGSGAIVRSSDCGKIKVVMVQQVEAVYENGILRPLQPLRLRESEKVMVSVSDESRDALDAVLDHGFIAYARAEVAKMAVIPTLEEVQRQLSTIEGSMSEFIIAERGEY